MMNLESIYTGAFLLAAAIVLYVELGYLWIDIGKPLKAKFISYASKLRTIVSDYGSGKYYKPWKSAVPIVIVSEKNQIAEYSEATCLSQRAVYADMFGFKHTMNNLDHNEHKVVRTRLYSRILQVQGPANLQRLFTSLQIRMQMKFDNTFERCARGDGYASLPLADTIQTLASELMSLMFFGQNLSSNKEFSEALLQYPKDMVKCMAAFQITPSFLSTLVHELLTKRGKAMHTIQNHLMNSLKDGCSNWDEPEQLKHFTIMYNMEELTRTSDYWNPELLSQSLLGIWFAAAHQPWMNLNFIILELCARQEWQVALREELMKHDSLDYKTLEQLPLLDSFIKETMRLNPLDKLAIRRKALQDYTFSDGSIHVPAGATVCVSAYDLMHDPHVYPKPDEFIGDRFVPQNSESQQKVTEVSDKFPVWGYGSLACPGRFHASLVVKLALSYLISHYDMRMEDEKAKKKWYWETFTMPYRSTRVVFKKRHQD